MGSVVVDRQPTAFGEWLIAQMSGMGISQTELAGRIGVAQATISRWVFRDIKPDEVKLNQLGDVLGLGRAARLEMFERAGYGQHAARTGQTGEVAPHPIVQEIRRMLDPDSPIPPEDLRILETLLDRVVDPYRKVMRRRRTA